MEEHQHLEVCVGLRGSSYIAGRDTFVPLSRHRSAVVFPGCPHSESVRKGQDSYSNLWLCFADQVDIQRTEYTHAPERFRVTVVARLVPPPQLNTTLTQFRALYEQHADELMLNGLWSLLLGQVLSSESVDAEAPSGRMARLVRFTVGAMHESPGAPWTVASLGALVGWSENHYSLRFREEMGTSPMRYLLRLRLERARAALLAEPHRRVSEIAYATGFNSLSYFSRRFREAYGAVPGRYRERAAPA